MQDNNQKESTMVSDMKIWLMALKLSAVDIVFMVVMAVCLFFLIKERSLYMKRRCVHEIYRKKRSPQKVSR